MSLVKVRFNADEIFNGQVQYSSDFIEIVEKYEGVVFDAHVLFGEYEIELDGQAFSLSEKQFIIEQQFQVFFEGETRDACTEHDVLDFVQDVTPLNVDIEALASDLNHMTVGDSVSLSKDCWIKRQY